MLDTGGWKHDPSEKGNLKVNGGCGVDTRNAAAEKMEDFIGESKTFEQAINHTETESLEHIVLETFSIITPRLILSSR